MRVLGVDNGLSGGLVVLGDTLGQGRTISLKEVMPVVTYMTTTNKTKREYDEQQIVRMLSNLKGLNLLDHAYIEKAQAFPGAGKKCPVCKQKRSQGVASTFSTGLGYGTIRGILSALKIPYTLVHPKTWQKSMFRDLPKTKTKEMSGIVCSRLWPETDWRASNRCRKSHEGLTDAALIAEYGWRTLTGQVA